MNRTIPLPSYEKPPLIEVALSVQFEPLEVLAPQLGLLWAEYRDKFPKIEEHHPLPTMSEIIGIRRPAEPIVRLQLLDSPNSSRYWFLSNAGDELLQVQPDRFTHNWRKVKDEDEYPRYEKVRATFQEEVEKFQVFLSREGVGELALNQCEVTYVNHIFPCEHWEHHGELHKVITIVSAGSDAGVLPKEESVQYVSHHVINDENDEFLGRLHISVESAYHKEDDVPIFVLKLTVRGRPLTEGLAGVLGFFDMGRELIVRGFTDITTDEMHNIWERHNV